MKAIGIVLSGLGIAEAFLALLFWTLEEYSGSQVSILYVLPGLAVAFLGLICLTREASGRHLT